MKNFKKELKKFANIFEYHEKTEQRNGFYSFSIEAMQKDNDLYDYYQIISDVLYEIKTNEDTLYEQSKRCIEIINEEIENGKIKNIKDLEELDIYEYTNNEVDIYTSNLTKWLASSDYNVYYLENAVNNNTANGFELLSMAQECCYNEIWQNVINAIIKFLSL